MGLEAVYQKPRLSKNNPEHRIYPYLLRNLDITGPNHVWCLDIIVEVIEGVVFKDGVGATDQPDRDAA